MAIAVSAADELISLIVCRAIRKVDAPAGRLTMVLATPSGDYATAIVIPESIAVDSHGNIYASETTGSSKVYRLSAGGDISVVPGLVSGKLAIDSQDRLYEVEVEESPTLRILRLAPGGAIVTLPDVNSVPPYTALNNIAMAPDRNGDLFIAGSALQRFSPTTIYRLDPKNQLAALPGSYPPTANFLAVDHYGDLWTTDYEQVLDATGLGMNYDSAR
ncbi:MAG TPA: hypothetical protein VHW24_00735, partial [Bryobacteraceae bacterium]|nr:hypothetical protein [Bryobacteraceae bacterium]